MIVFQSLILLIAFLLELCMLGAVGYWGFKVGDGTATQVLLGVGAPLVMAVVWGLFVAPRATLEVPGPVRLGLQAVLFGAAAAALAHVASPALAAGFLAAVVANLALVGALGS
jgi:hypothetical protein